MLLFKANCNRMFLLEYKPPKFSYCTNRKSGLDPHTTVALPRIQTKQNIWGENYIFTSFSRKTNNNI